MKKISLFLLIILNIVGCKHDHREFTYKMVNGQHHYLFENIYSDILLEDDELLETVEWMITHHKDLSEFSEVTINRDKKSMQIISEKPINNIKGFCDSYAGSTGVLPYWEEIITREKKSPNFSMNTYKKVGNSFYIFDGYLEDEYYGRFSNPEPIDLLVTEKKLTQKLDLVYQKGNKRGYIKANKNRCAGMGLPGYIIRLYTSDDKYIWESDIYNLKHHFIPAVQDLDNDGVDEIIIIHPRNEEVFIYKKNE